MVLARQHCWRSHEITTNPHLLRAVHEDRFTSAQSKYPVTLRRETGCDSRELMHRGNVFPDLLPAGWRGRASSARGEPAATR